MRPGQFSATLGTARLKRTWFVSRMLTGAELGEMLDETSHTGWTVLEILSDIPVVTSPRAAFRIVAFKDT